ncbi:hypothetical protein HK098_006726 [Nowakowskiella sp. JEL0407]|nr:hypothetical protein HK098_006726 [Nowakowskiella sp. JEL0407]
MNNDDKFARFYQSNGFFNLTDFSYKVNDTVSYFTDPSNFTLNYPPSVGATIFDRNKTGTSSKIIENIISALSSTLIDDKWFINGIYILRDNSIPKTEFAKIFERPIFSPDYRRNIMGTVFYTDLDIPELVLGEIPQNSLGSILENNPNIKPSEIKGPVVYQSMTITGIVPDTETAKSNASYWGWMISLSVIAVLIVGFIAVKRWYNNRSTPGQIELNVVAQTPKPTSLPVLTAQDLEKIECLTYDSTVGTSGSAANTEKPSTLTRSILKRTFTSQSVVDPSCSICLETFKLKEEIRKLPHCNHSFHKECIDGWLLEQSCCCPNCRYDMRIALRIEIEEDVEDGGGSVREEVLQIPEEEEIVIDTEVGDLEDANESEQKQTKIGESATVATVSGTNLGEVIVDVRAIEEIETRKD